MIILHYSRCCPSCKAWASNNVGIGCLPSVDQESELQKIISYSYEDINSYSDENPKKEVTICNLCKELNKKRTPIDAFTEHLELESTTKTIQDYESSSDQLTTELDTKKGQKKKSNTEILSSITPEVYSTTNSNRYRQEMMETTTPNDELKDVSTIHQMEEENVNNESKQIPREVKDKVSSETKYSVKESIKPDVSSESFENDEKSTKQDKTLKKESKKFEEKSESYETSSKKVDKDEKGRKNYKILEEEITYYEEEITDDDTSPEKTKKKKLPKEEDIHKKDMDIFEYEESKEDTFEKNKDNTKVGSKAKEKVSEDKSEELEHKEAELEKEETYGLGEESGSGSGGSDDDEDDDIYNGYGDNIATLKMGKCFNIIPRY